MDDREAMERKQAHKILFNYLVDIASAKELQEMESEVQRRLGLRVDEKEAQAEALFRRLAVFTADKLSLKYPR
jgi:hypothetical protein